jgi:hypothetical protein
MERTWQAGGWTLVERNFIESPFLRKPDFGRKTFYQIRTLVERTLAEKDFGRTGLW